MTEFLPLVEDYWAGTEKLFHSTSAMFRLSKKLKALKPIMKKLSREKFGELPKRAKKAYENLCEKQNETLHRPSPDAVKEEAEAYDKWYNVAELEEEFFKQKSKLHWLQVGDQNNKIFHNAVKVREARNTIREVQCSDGAIVSSHEEIKHEAERFIKDFLTLKPSDFMGVTVERLQSLLEFRCTENHWKQLEREVTVEEVHKVLFSMPSNKSPGPDGYTFEFFRSAWPVIGQDFTVAIQSFFLKGFLPKGINSTILALIPKKLEAKEMRDYRPISCCNVLYKVISKIIANRLKGLLPLFIAPNQSAFVKDRLLMENLLLATELVKDYHKESISSRSAIKIDISKAFDSVQWTFLLNTLTAMNIPPKFIRWISLCISTASFSVQVNGELAGFFRSERGLRQGCSLSPYLFVICMNVLSKMLDKAAQARRFGYHPQCQNIPLTHLCFADDLMVFTDGKQRSLEGILEVFDTFASYSGLKISLEKSTLYMAGISQPNRDAILLNFPFDSGTLPVRYLGLPLLTKCMTSNDYAPLIEKIKGRISSWTVRPLSYAGRLQLIRSVLLSMVNFWSAAFRLPRSCIREIESVCSAFLWSGPELNTHKLRGMWSRNREMREDWVLKS